MKIKFPKLKARRKNQKKKLFNKKILIGTCLAVVVAIGGFFVIRGMQEETVYKSAMKNVAEARYFMKHETRNDIDVQFYAGIREEKFTQDGHADKPVPFAIINVQLAKEYKEIPQITGTIKIANEPYDLVLIKNPTDPLNFTNDIAKSLRRTVRADDKIEITLLIDTVTTPSMELKTTLPSNAISWEEALRIATEHHAKDLKGKTFEAYVTIMHNVKDNNGYWYVRFVTDENKSEFCVVSADGTCVV